MVRQNATTTEAAIYHTTFDADDPAFETARDLRMGYEWVEDECDFDVADTFADAYDHAGTVDVTVEPDGSGEAAREAYEAWETGEGHDPTETRSMSVGDLILIDGTVWFVDNIGFVAVDLDLDDEDGDAEDDTDDRDFEEGDDVVVDDHACPVNGDACDATGEYLRDEGDTGAWVDFDCGVRTMVFKPDVRHADADDGTDDDGDDALDRGEYFGMTYDPTPSDAEIAEAFGVEDVDDITDDMLDDVDTDVPDALTDVVDLGDYATAHGAAKAAGRKIEAIAEEFGHDPSIEVTVEKRDGRDGERWVVSYPAGDHDWAVRLTGGDAVYGGTRPLITGFYDADGWSVECGSGTMLEFYPRG